MLKRGVALEGDQEAHPLNRVECVEKTGIELAENTEEVRDKWLLLL